MTSRFRPLGMALCAGLWLASLSGCQVIIGSLLILTGRPLQECEFSKQTKGDKLAGKGKKIVVLCSVPDSARAEYGGLDVDIITHVSRSLREAKVDVADSQKVATWIDDHGANVDSVQMLEITKRFKANYVILVHFEEFSFREANSPDMFRGRARGHVSVTQIDEKNGERSARSIFNTVIASTYPGNQPIPADERGATFRLEYVQRVGDDIARLFHDYRPEEAM